MHPRLCGCLLATIVMLLAVGTRAVPLASADVPTPFQSHPVALGFDHPLLAVDGPAVDCDNDPSTEPDGDPDEMDECYPLPGDAWLGLAEKAAFVTTIALGVVLASETLPVVIGGLAFIEATGGFGAGVTVFAYGGEFSANALFLSDAATFLGIDALTGLALGMLHDPVDNSTAVALPEPLTLASRPLAGSLCRRSPNEARCRAFVAGNAQYVRVLGRTVSVVRALYTTANRYQSAKRRHDLETEIAQAAVGKIETGWLADALDAQSRAGKAFASKLQRLHMDIRLSRAQARAAASEIARLQGASASAYTKAARLVGVTRSQLRSLLSAAVSRAFPSRGGLDLQRSLSAPFSTAPLRQTFGALTPAEAGYLIKSLYGHGKLKRTTASNLVNDLLLSEQGCSSRERAGPIAQFRSDAAGAGAYASLFRAATGALTGAHPPTTNVAPAASFRSSPTSERLDSNGRARFAFFDSSSDKQDDGHVVCWQWDFGDPSSASNSSTAQNPAHDYTAAGNYTVTLAVTDDDGFATSHTSETVTVLPPH